MPTIDVSLAFILGVRSSTSQIARVATYRTLQNTKTPFSWPSLLVTSYSPRTIKWDGNGGKPSSEVSGSIGTVVIFRAR